MQNYEQNYQRNEKI